MIWIWVWGAKRRTRGLENGPGCQNGSLQNGFSRTNLAIERTKMGDFSDNFLIFLAKDSRTFFSNEGLKNGIMSQMGDLVNGQRGVKWGSLPRHIPVSPFKVTVPPGERQYGSSGVSIRLWKQNGFQFQVYISQHTVTGIRLVLDTASRFREPWTMGNYPLLLDTNTRRKTRLPSSKRDEKRHTNRVIAPNRTLGDFLSEPLHRPLHTQLTIDRCKVACRVGLFWLHVPSWLYSEIYSRC